MFVKCGQFECGQDSFNAQDHLAGVQQTGQQFVDRQMSRLDAARQQQNGATANSRQAESGIVAADFPWLVSSSPSLFSSLSLLGLVS